MGWSDSPSHRGFGIKKAAEGFHILMNRLGYTEYIVHGSGYLGYALARMLSILYPQSIKGIHITDVVLQPPTWRRMAGKKMKLQCSKVLGTPWSKDEVQRISTVRSAKDPGLDDQTERSRQQKLVWEYALTDSPIGLLSWVVGRIRKGATSKVCFAHSPSTTSMEVADREAVHLDLLGDSHGVHVLLDPRSSGLYAYPRDQPGARRAGHDRASPQQRTYRHLHSERPETPRRLP
jgi:hypothetical protein